MRKKSKRYISGLSIIKETGKILFGLSDGVLLLLSLPKAKFDETVEISFSLGVNPKHADQQVRGTVHLPHGTGRKVRVVAFAKGEPAKEAEAAGADFVGDADLIDKITKGWLDFDVACATPDMMKDVGKLGKILGRLGLMPNPKAGTVSFEIGRVVKEVKAGKIEYKVDKDGNLHLPVGKVSFGAEKLMENVSSVAEAVVKAKPQGAKGKYIKSASLSLSMGPSIRLEEVGIFGPSKGGL